MPPGPRGTLQQTKQIYLVRKMWKSFESLGRVKIRFGESRRSILVSFEPWKKLRGLTYFKTQYSRPLPLIIAPARLSRPDIIVYSRTIGNFCFILCIEIGQPNSYILSIVQIWCAENIRLTYHLTIKIGIKLNDYFSPCLQHGNDSPLLSCHDPIYLQVEMRYASMNVPCSLLAALPAGRWLEPRCKAWDVPRKRSWHHRHLARLKKRGWKLMIPWKR